MSERTELAPTLAQPLASSGSFGCWPSRPRQAMAHCPRNAALARLAAMQPLSDRDTTCPPQKVKAVSPPRFAPGLGGASPGNGEKLQSLPAYAIRPPCHQLHTCMHATMPFEGLAAGKIMGRRTQSIDDHQKKYEWLAQAAE